MESGISVIIRIMLFVLMSAFMAVFFRRHLKNPKCHGFYRFFVFEGTLAIVLLNIPFWFKNPVSPLQLVSWVILFFSVVFLVWGFSSLTKLGGTRGSIEDSENLAFENTITLVTEGLYKYIRHPMYSSLLFLVWGALLKHLTIHGFLIVLITSAFLVVTAKIEERENSLFFGSNYEEYKKRTRMFIPYLF